MAESKVNTHWPERIEAQQRRVRAAEAAIQTYVREQPAAISREKKERDTEAQQRVQRAAEELRDASEPSRLQPLSGGRSSSQAGTAGASRPRALPLAAELKRAIAGGFRSPTPRGLDATSSWQPDPSPTGGRGRMAERRAGHDGVRLVTDDLEQIRRDLVKAGFPDVAAFVGVPLGEQEAKRTRPARSSPVEFGWRDDDLEAA